MCDLIVIDIRIKIGMKELVIALHITTRDPHIFSELPLMEVVWPANLLSFNKFWHCGKTQMCMVYINGTACPGQTMSTTTANQKVEVLCMARPGVQV